MNLFHINARTEHSGEHDAKTWLVIARNLPEAAALIPAGQIVVSIEVHSPCRVGPPRLVGWMGPPPSYVLDNSAAPTSVNARECVKDKADCRALGRARRQGSPTVPAYIAGG